MYLNWTHTIHTHFSVDLKCTICHGYGGGPSNLNAVPERHIPDGDDTDLPKPWGYLATLFHNGWAPLTMWGGVVLVLFCTPFGLVPLQFGVISNIINSGLDMS